MSKTKIKLDKRNSRLHSEKNKTVIHDSLKHLGAARSIVVDGQDVVIAGNGVYEQAQRLGIPVRIVESDGKELIAVKRTDLKTDDEKRKALALADNQIGDLSEFDCAQLDALLNELTPELKQIAGFDNSVDNKNDLEELKPKVIETHFFKKTHILISFPPGILLDIQDKLADIIKMEGVEYEQSSN